ncbi:MAG: thiamine pyrophosphate-dependent dehydrogenase E1 component subunit alpha [bacterium]|nr:thiamine pyrophosphate-dependent dehydrogenase E1 component subunit alpha [bacterium]
MTEELLSQFYREMLRIRLAEEKLIELWHANEIRSLMHLSTGQEAVAVGVCQALAEEDLIVSTHRCHAHYLAKGGSLKKMYAELAGKVGGCSRGKGGSMHLFEPSAGVFLSLPIVAGSIPIAVGTAFSAQLKGIRRVTVAFFGDGAVEEGVFWESLNFSQVHHLPVIFVCENNLYATHSHIIKRQPNDQIASRLSGYGVYAETVDGNDVESVYEMTLKMIGRSLSGQGPSFLEAKTYRLKEHWGPGEDWHLGYRWEAEGDMWRKKCPLLRLSDRLGGALINQKNFALMTEQINAEIAEAVDFAKSSPEPEEKELYQW